MIDHLLSFPDEATALAALASTSFVTDSGEGSDFDLSRCFPDVHLVTADAVLDEEGETITPEQRFPGWWLVISTDGDETDPELAAMESCRLVADRGRAARGEPFIFPTGLRALPEQIATVVRIDGLPAGSAYPFESAAVIA